MASEPDIVNLVDRSSQNVDHVNDIVTRLFKTSALIVSHTSTDRYVRAESRKEHFTDVCDIAHVRSKFTSKDGCNDWLLIRLGKAITKRRQFLRYAREHYEKIVDDSDSEDAAELTKTAKEKLQTRDQLSRDAVTKRHSISNPTEKHTRASTMVPVVMEDILEREDSSTLATSINGLQSKDRLSVPQLSGVAELGNDFVCPYCWKAHAFSRHLAWKYVIFLVWCE